MSNTKKFDEKTNSLPKDDAVIARVATQILEPALQKALGDAKEQASPQEILSALANCYAGLLIDLLGAKAASSFMKDHAQHILSREESRITSQKD
jgi:hypothetical protein